MPRLSDTAPPRLLGVTDIKMLALEPRPVGIIVLDTDDGPIELAINVSGAADLAGWLVDFLAAREHEADEAANDG